MKSLKALARSATETALENKLSSGILLLLSLLGTLFWAAFDRISAVIEPHTSKQQLIAVSGALLLGLIATWLFLFVHWFKGRPTRAYKFDPFSGTYEHRSTGDRVCGKCWPSIRPVKIVSFSDRRAWKCPYCGNAHFEDSEPSVSVF